jgi:hypothetical protein
MKIGMSRDCNIYRLVQGFCYFDFWHKYALVYSHIENQQICTVRVKFSVLKSILPRAYNCLQDGPCFLSEQEVGGRSAISAENVMLKNGAWRTISAPFTPRRGRTGATVAQPPLPARRAWTSMAILTPQKGRSSASTVLSRIRPRLIWPSIRKVICQRLPPGLGIHSRCD